MNIHNTLSQRGTTHGDFTHNAVISQSIKATLESGPNWDSMPGVQKEALHMIAHKMSRIVAGDNNHQDHWHDIIGYAQLAHDRIQPIHKAHEGPVPLPDSDEGVV